MNELVVSVASIVAVAFMVAIAAVLGFRKTARLTADTLSGLAKAERAALEEALIGADGKAALARLSGGKVLAARVMGADVSVRVAPASALKLREARGKLTVRFGDLGYPPLHLKLEQAAPAWLAELVQGARS